jgi:hypothetical protein
VVVGAAAFSSYGDWCHFSPRRLFVARCYIVFVVYTRI